MKKVIFSETIAACDMKVGIWFFGVVCFFV